MTLSLLFEEWASSLGVAAFDLPCLLVILILFIKAPAAPVLETLGPQVNPTLALFSQDHGPAREVGAGETEDPSCMG